MLRNLSIGKRIGIGSALVLILAIGVITPVVLYVANSIVHEAERRELQSLFGQVVEKIDAEQRVATALAEAIASQERLGALFAAGDRDALAAELLPVFERLRDRFAVEQFQFHSPPAFSFLRLHKVGKFGDDLSSFRHTVVEVNTDRRAVSGLEKGVAGLGIRGVVPVRYRGEHVGSVEFGMSFGQPFFDALKRDHEASGLELALHVRDGSGFKPFARTFSADSLLETAQLEQALDTPVLGRTRMGEHSKSVYAGAVTDYSGKPVGVLELAVDRDYYEQALGDARNAVLVVGAIALALGLGVAWLVACSITRPMASTVAAMNDIAEGEGDLTARLDTSGNDELTHLAEAFNRFAEKVRRTVADVAGSTAQLAAASEELSTITTHSREAVDRQQHETEQVVTAMNEMTSTVQEIARNADAAAAAARDADKESRNGNGVVNATIDAIDALVQEIQRTAAAIQRLEQESTSIGGVVDVIQAVAEQTNLLALNAAIEAARAGEQGRGFAVVADEVRTLASRTHDSTEEIKAMVERLQKGARDAVQAMASGSERAQGTVEQAARAGDALNAITQAVATISDMNTQIASAAEEQSAVSEEINRNIHAINDITEENTKGARETSESSEALAQLAHELQQLVGQFRYEARG